MRRTAARTLAGSTLVLAMLAGVGAGVSHIGEALAAVGMRRADMLAAGVDMMPVGTAKQADRAKRLRRQMP